MVLIATCLGSNLPEIQIGPDEHFEVNKSLLWAKGYPLYTRIWNDQPPLYTVLLGMLFKCFGPSIIVARGLAAGFGLLLLTAFFIAVKRTSGSLAACVASFCLITAPEVVKVGISVMLEVPAIATGLCALLPLYRWKNNSGRSWLMASGLVFGAALQVKYTALILLPALTVEIVLLSWQKERTSRIMQSLDNCVVWFGIVAIAFLLIGMVLSSGYGEAWQSHFSPASRRVAETRSLTFSILALLEHQEGLWGGVAGLLFATIDRGWRQTALPVTLLATAIGIFCCHRPYWDYYYLYIAVPLAWLTGYAIVGLLRFAWAEGAKGFFRSPWMRLFSYLIGSVLVVTSLTEGGTRLMSQVEEIRHLPSVHDREAISKMKEFASQTKWIYCMDNSIYAFYAGLPVIPELAVLPRKRFWSGQINDEQIAAIVQRYRPEQVMLTCPEPPEALKAFMASTYVLVCDEDSCFLYVEKSLINK